MTVLGAASVFEHAALLHDGPADLAARLAPTVQAAVERREAVLVCLRPDEVHHLAAQLPVADEVTFIEADDRYARPGVAMSTLHDFAGAALAGGAPAVWSIGSIPFDGRDDDRRWVRYEAAVHDVLGHLPVRALCAYDVRRTPGALLDAACSTHDSVEHLVGHVPEAAPAVLEVAPTLPTSAPLLRGQVTVPSAMRHQLSTALAARVGAEAMGDVLLVATELASNALCYGASPVELTVWATPGSVVVRMADRGPGPVDAHADLRERHGGADGGFGLWLVGQLADHVHIEGSELGTVVTAAFLTASAE